MKNKININKQKMHLFLNRLGYFVLIFIVAGIVISAVEYKKVSRTTDITMNIKQLEDSYTLVSEQDILKTMERSFGSTLVGVPIEEIDVARVETVLEEVPFIKNADVYIDAQNKIHIAIEQRKPIIRIIDNNGFNYYMDKNGHKMPLSKHHSANVMVVTGNVIPYTEDFLDMERPNILRDVFNLVKICQKDEFLHAQIEQIYVNKLGELVLIPKIGNHKILFGKFENVNDKLERLKVFYKEAIPYEGWNKYKSISLKFKGQVVAKKK